MTPKTKLNVDEKALSKLKLVAVAYSYVDREQFATEAAYEAEKEVEERAQQVIQAISDLKVEVKAYPADEHFLTDVLIDRPDLVVNLVDTLRGVDRLCSAVPGVLEYANIPYTGCRLTGMVVGNNRHLCKEMLEHYHIPTPRYKFIKDLRSNTAPDFEPPYIVKLNEGGGGMGIDDKAVKETAAAAQKRVEALYGEYGLPVLVEQFIDGPELAGIVFDDGAAQQVFMAQKSFRRKPDSKHEFTSQQPNGQPASYRFELMDDDELCQTASELCVKAFDALRFTDYAKFDMRVDARNNTPYFIDANPNTAFGPAKGLPLTEILSLYGLQFPEILASLLSKHAKSIRPPKEV